MTLSAQMHRTLAHVRTIGLSGTVSEVRGLSLLVDDLPLPVGSMVTVESDEPRVGEVVGFDNQQTIIMLMGQTQGIARGHRVRGVAGGNLVRVGERLLGRVVDGLGRPIDHAGPIADTVTRPVQPEPLQALQRVPIDTPLGTGVRSLDAVLTVGRGQRLGIFAGPGIGKSTLLGQIARNTDADISVIALIGERGREVNDFIRASLGEEGLQRSVVIVSTGDEPALMRIRATMYAMAVAEFFRDAGMDVVFFMDSITRLCQAQRQIGLAAGEPPATKGFTPSVFAMLPTLLERSGRTQVGSITGFYTILVEGDDLTEPISDAARGILDGHVVLSRDLANRGHWPAIDVLQSISRVANDVTDGTHQEARRQVIRLIAAYRDVEDLVNIGAYASGSNPLYDLAIAMKEPIDRFLQQTTDEGPSFEQVHAQLVKLAHQAQETEATLAARAGRGGAGPQIARPAAGRQRGT
jgi:flagellum-specific ATP synthase